MRLIIRVDVVAINVDVVRNTIRFDGICHPPATEG